MRIVRIVSKCWKQHFLRVEALVAVIVALAFIIWVERFGGYLLIEKTLIKSRNDIYSVSAQIFASLLGFTITAESIILGYSTNERLTIVRESQHWPQLWGVFKKGIRALALATVTALMGLVLDGNQNPIRVLFYLYSFAAILAGFRLARCIWVLENVVRLVTARPQSG